MFKVPGNSEIMPGGPEGLVKKLVFVLELNLNRWKWPEVGEEGHSAGGRGVLLEKDVATHSSNSCQQNPTDRGAWQAVIHRITKIWT